VSSSVIDFASVFEISSEKKQTDRLTLPLDCRRRWQKQNGSYLMHMMQENYAQFKAAELWSNAVYRLKEAGRIVFE